MFDVNFSELLVIAIVTLVVVGPARLPKVARTLGLLFGRVQRYVSEVKSDINRELKLEELRKIQSDMNASVRNMEHTMTDEINRAEQGIKAAAESVEAQVAPAPPALHTESAPAAPVSPQLELGLETLPLKPEKSA